MPGKNTVMKLLILAMVGLLALRGVCFGAAPAQVKIGALLPLTGIGASLGSGSLATFQIAKNDFQATYPGNTVELITEDTCSDGATALTKLQALYQQGVRVVIGPYMSNEILAVKEFAAAHGMVIISPISTATTLCQNDNILRLSLDNFKQAEAMVSFLQNQGITQVVVVHAADSYGSDLANALLNKSDKTALQLAHPITYDPAKADFAAIAANIHDTIQKTEATIGLQHIGVMLIGYDESVEIMKAAADDALLSGVRWFGSDSIAKRNIFLADENVAAFCRQTRFTTAVEDRQAFSMPVSPFSYLEQHLVQKLLASGQPMADSTVYNTYDSFMLAAMTLAKLSGRQPEGEALKAALAAKAKYLFGNNARLALNEFGDIENGNIGFYQVTKTGPGYRWEITASYPFRSGTGFPYPSRVLLYREFNPEVAAPEITVGTLLPLTGNISYRGEPALKAIKQAQKDIAQTFDGYYRKAPAIRLVVKDTRSDPQTALQELQALKAQGVKLVIGPVGSEELAAVQKYANDNDILLFSPSSSAPSLAAPDNVFRLSLNDTKQAQALASFCAHEGLKDILVLMNDGIYAKELYQEFKSAYQATGGNVTDPVVYSRDAKEFGPCLDSLNRSAQQYANRGKAAVLLIAFDEAAQIMAKASAYPNLASLRWLGTDSTALSASLVKSPEAAAFAGQTKFTASIMSSPVRENELGNSVVTDVIYHDLCATIGQALSSNDTNSYDAMWLIAYMYANKNFEFASFADYKSALAAVASQMITVNGAVKFDGNGDKMVGNFAFNQIVAEPDSGYAWKMIGSYFSSQTAAKIKYFPVDE